MQEKTFGRNFVKIDLHHWRDVQSI
ncbi:hypothetical protein V1477_010355 [Vespula maculifrons]|uniref:Uncharacterized protein n=1 Tax=Vespula maculifrons TaxID=7453 RepID=A0ABD2C8B8_VESMC